MRGTVLVLAALAAAPWAVVGVAGAGRAGPWLVAICLLASAAMLLALFHALRPIAAAARLLRTRHQDWQDEANADAGDISLLADGTRLLLGRLDALEHRWVQRHALTGLPIRESLLKVIDADLAADAAPALVGVIRFADYKRLAAFDPDAAEAALKQFSEKLAASLGKTRPLAHVDRDCFAVWFRGAAPDQARAELGVICYALSAEIDARGLVVFPEIEAGTAAFPADAASGAALLNHALVSLAKIDGQSGTETLGPRPAHLARERFTLEQGLRQAIERHELELDFQPVVDVSRGLLVGAEALLRWRHPQAGLIGPDRFIPVLEDSDLTGEIGMWVLNAACREVKGWHQAGLVPLKVAVNLSAKQLRDPQLKAAIQGTIKRHKLPPGALELELTETAAAQDADRTRALFGELRALGVSLAIDDFGSGYSSLSYLKNLPFDKLKIDREFVTDVHLRRDSQAICRSLIELSRGLGIQVLAEGVETVEEVETLQSFGCSLFQGFYFSKPLSAEDFVRYARHPDGRAPGHDARAQQRKLQKRIRA